MSHTSSNIDIIAVVRTPANAVWDALNANFAAHHVHFGYHVERMPPESSYVQMQRRRRTGKRKPVVAVKERAHR